MKSNFSKINSLNFRDRCQNSSTYPALYYPEIYLLHNGYKEFWENYPELCEPRGYQPMADPKFSQEEKIFRKKSKTWHLCGTVPRTMAGSRLLKM